MIGLSVHTAFHLRRNWFKEFANVDVYILTSLYFLSLICFAYTTNAAEGRFDLTKELGILIFPLLFGCTTLDISKYKDQLLFAFSIACTTAVIFLYFKAFQVLNFYQLPLSFLFSDGLLNQHFSQPLNLHATYLSMYLGMALIFMLKRFIYKKTVEEKILLGFFVIILVAALIQLASRSVCISMAIIVLIFPFVQGSPKKKGVFIVVAVFILSGAIVFIQNNIFLHGRYITGLEQDLNPNLADDGRVARWGAIKELIRKRPFFGYGTGSETQILKSKYLEKNMVTAYNLGLNTHSQYLGYFLRAGVAGLLIYLFTLYFGFRKAFQSREILFLGFMIIIAIVSISENILDVNKGIFYYSFFFSFFLYSTREFRIIVE